MTARNVDADYLKMADVQAVREQLGSRIVAATGVMTNFDRLVIQGKEEDVKVIGSDDYRQLEDHCACCGDDVWI